MIDKSYYKHYILQGWYHEISQHKNKNKSRYTIFYPFWCPPSQIILIWVTMIDLTPVSSLATKIVVWYFSKITETVKIVSYHDRCTKLVCHYRWWRHCLNFPNQMDHSALMKSGQTWIDSTSPVCAPRWWKTWPTKSGTSQQCYMLGWRH